MAATATERKLLLDGEWIETGDWLEVRSPYDGRSWRGCRGRRRRGAARVDAAERAMREPLPAHKRAEILVRVAGALGRRADEAARQISRRGGQAAEGGTRRGGGRCRRTRWPRSRRASSPARSSRWSLAGGRGQARVHDPRAGRRRRRDLAVQLPAQPRGPQDRAGARGRAARSSSSRPRRRRSRRSCSPSSRRRPGSRRLAERARRPGRGDRRRARRGRARAADHVHRLERRRLGAAGAGAAQERQPRARQRDAGDRRARTPTSTTWPRGRGERLLLRRAELHLGAARLRAPRRLRRFLERFLPKVEALDVGDPADEDTDVGPLISDRARPRAGVDRGGASGRRRPRRRRPRRRSSCGRRSSPTPPAEAKVSCEEAFGPSCTVTAYDTLDEAIELAERHALRPAGTASSRRASKGARAAARARVRRRDRQRGADLPRRPDAVRRRQGLRQHARGAGLVRELTEERLVVLKALSPAPTGGPRVARGNSASMDRCEFPPLLCTPRRRPTWADPSGRGPLTSGAGRRDRPAAGLCPHPSPAAPRRRRVAPPASELRRERRALMRSARSASATSAGSRSRFYRRDRFREDLLVERCTDLIALEARIHEPTRCSPVQPAPPLDTGRPLRVRCAAARGMNSARPAAAPVSGRGRHARVSAGGAPPAATQRGLCPRCGSPFDVEQEYLPEAVCGCRGGARSSRSSRLVRLPVARRVPRDWVWPALLVLVVAALGAAGAGSISRAARPRRRSGRDRRVRFVDGHDVPLPAPPEQPGPTRGTRSTVGAHRAAGQPHPLAARP